MAIHIIISWILGSGPRWYGKWHSHVIQEQGNNYSWVDLIAFLFEVFKYCFSDKFSLRTFIFPHAKFLKTRNLHLLWLQTKLCLILTTPWLPVYKRFLVHLSRRLKCTIVIMRCPSSVRRPSVVRLSSLTFHIFDFSSETAERNSTKLDRKQDLNVLYKVCVFWADRKNKMAALASDSLRHFRLLLWNCWTEFNETWQEARSQCPLPSLCFSGRSEKQDGRPGLWLAETFSTSPLELLNGIQGNLTGSKISTSSTKFVFFGPIGKTRWPPWSLIGWDIFNFSSETAERNSTKLDRKQDLNVLYQVCVFWADRKIKMAALASDWLRHFRLLLWNRWTKLNENWQEARSQCPLPSLCFSGRSEKQDGRPGLWLAEIFSTSPLKPLNGIQRNLTGSKISTSSTKFVFFGPVGKTRWPPWPLIGWDIFDFSSETAERNWTKLDRKQDLNVLYQVCVFRADWKNKMPPWPICQKGGTLYSGARYVALWASCYCNIYLCMIDNV